MVGVLEAIPIQTVININSTMIQLVRVRLLLRTSYNFLYIQLQTKS